MNYSIAVFLINPNTRAILCTYEEGEKAARTLFKTFDPSIKVGDFVVVPTDTRHKMTVVKVVETDADFDPDTTAQITWIIGKVDRSGFEKITEQEAEAIAAVKAAELRKKRNALRDTMLADQAEALKELPIAGAGGAPALEPPPVAKVS